MDDYSSIAIVIVNYCRLQDTMECIESIFRNNIFLFDPVIILIDNGSTDNSYAIFQQVYKKNKKIILDHTNKNLGFSGGYNRGIQIAIDKKVDWVFLLNNDTVIENNAINLLINPDYDIVIPKILVHAQPEIIWSAGSKWRRFPPGVVIRGYFKKDNIRYNNQEMIEYATGCAVMIKREALLKLGGFDEEFISYLEDNDFFYRANKLKLRILYQPKSIIYHKISKTFGEYSKKKWFLLGRNSALFYLKNNRFSFFILINYAVWFIAREIIKRNITLIPSFSRGLISGIHQVHSKNREHKK